MPAGIRHGRILRLWGALLAASLWCLLAAPDWARAAAKEPGDLAWRPPAQMRVMRWPPRNAPASPRDPSAWARLAPGELLLVPVDAGDLARVEGEDLRVGIGSGQALLPDAITWLPPQDNPAKVHVPTWTLGRFLAVRATGSTPSQVRVHLAADRTDAMAFYRADEAVGRWLFDADGVPRLPGPLRPLDAAVRFLDVARRTLGDLASTHAGGAWLQARWLELCVPSRPPTFPFVAPEPLTVLGGRPLERAEFKAVDPRGIHQHRLLAAGQRLILTSSAADMATLLVRSRAVGSIDLELRSGSTILQRSLLTIPRRAQDPNRWTQPRLFRVPLSREAPAVLRVMRGEVWVALRGHRLRPALFGRRQLRDRPALLRSAIGWLEEPGRVEKSPRLQWLLALVRAALFKDRPAAEDLSRYANDPSLTVEERALTWHELITYGLGSSTSQRALALGMWRATDQLPDATRLVLRRSAMERVADAVKGYVEPPLSGELAEPLLPSSRGEGSSLPRGIAEDQIRLALARETVDPPRDNARSSVAPASEQLARTEAHRSDLVERARRVWFDATRWIFAEPEQSWAAVTRVEPVFDTLPSELCTTEGQRGPRWWRVDHRARRARVRTGAGTHARVLVRSADGVPAADSVLLIDGVPTTVHGGAQLGATVAVAPGERTFAVSEGPPVLVSVPLDDPVLCGDLRETERWVPVGDWTRFRVPPGAAGTAASLLVDPRALSGKPHALRVRAGDQVTEAWVGGNATGSIDIGIPAGIDTVSVQADRRTLVRLRVRVHPRGGTARRVTPTQLSTPARERDLIERIRANTRKLRHPVSVSDGQALRRDRAEALEELGYGRLADVDRARAGDRPGIEPEGPGEAESGNDLELPPGSGAVVPLGHLAKIPPLSSPDDRRALDQAVARKVAGAPPGEVLTALGRTAEASNHVDALLLAVLSEETGDLLRAAAALERIGRSRPSGEALSWAADLLTDAAASSGDTRAALKAYLVARMAVAQDAPPSSALARLGASVEWHQVGAESAAGVAWVERTWADPPERSPGDRVRGALLDAPEHSRLLGSEPRGVGLSSVAGGALRLTLLCHSLDGPDEDCRYRLRVDDRPVSCDQSLAEARAESSDLAPPGGIPRIQTCQLTVPTDGRRLVIQPPTDVESLGWVVAHRPSEETLLPLTVVGRWTESDPLRPLRLTVDGPTVLRVSAQGEAQVAAVLSVRLAPRHDGPVASPPTQIHLDPTPDPMSQRRGEAAALGRLGTQYVPVPFEGPVSVSIATTARVLTRVEAAVAVGPPRSRTIPAQSSVLPPGGPRASVPEKEAVLPPVTWDPEPGPLSFGGYISGVTGRILETDLDSPRHFVEVGGRARRAGIAGLLSGEAVAFERIRSGSPSTGLQLEMSTDIPPLATNDFSIGAYARTRVATQRIGVHQAVGILSNLRILGRYGLNDELTLSPLVAATVRSPDTRAGSGSEIDPDVSTSYARRRPRSLDVGVYLGHRPATDAIFRYGLISRLAPNLDGMDTTEVSGRWRILPGTGLMPFITVEAALSWRPESPVRATGFWRAMAGPSIVFWRWLERDHRLTAALSGTYYHDFPVTPGPDTGISAALTFAYDFVWGRGLDDFSPADKPFQERLEEPLQRPYRSGPARDPYWEGSRE